MKNIPFLFLLIYSISNQILAQDTFDPDELLGQAREQIMDGNYQEGRKIAFRALGQYPDYADILILVGRSYAWEGAYDSASVYFERAIVVSPKYADGYSAYLDNLSWEGEFDKAKEVLAKAKSNLGSPLPDEIRYKESRLNYNLENYDLAYEEAQSLFDKGYNQDGFLAYLQNLQRFRRNNAVGVTFDYDTFSDGISPWQTISVYGRTRTDLTGALIARVTNSSRYDDNGTLFELDAYPSLGKNAYAYLNIGGSSASFFPKFRAGASIYYNLPKAWEIEGGYRYLGFSEVTHIYTASLGKYVGNWWFNLRVNVVPAATGAGTSSNIQARYYFKTAEDFFSLQLSTGVSPDEETRDQSQLLNSYRARIGYQQLITSRFMIFGFTGYSRDELSAEKYRNNFNISAGVEYRF